jgi:MFS family permease
MMISQKARELSTSEVRILSLASIGGALEFYDFVIFVFFATVIGKLFFAPSLPDWVRQVQTFGIVTAGYLARPIGGVVMAHFGDTRGRKRMFTLSVLLMAIPTLLGYGNDSGQNGPFGERDSHSSSGVPSRGV